MRTLLILATFCVLSIAASGTYLFAGAPIVVGRSPMFDTQFNIHKTAPKMRAYVVDMFGDAPFPTGRIKEAPILTVKDHLGVLELAQNVFALFALSVIGVTYFVIVGVVAIIGGIWEGSWSYGLKGAAVLFLCAPFIALVGPAALSPLFLFDECSWLYLAIFWLVVIISWIPTVLMFGALLNAAFGVFTAGSGGDSAIRIQPGTGEIQARGFLGWRSTLHRFNPRSGVLQVLSWLGWRDK